MTWALLWLLAQDRPLATLPEGVRDADIAVSPGGERAAYVRRRGDGAFVVVDGREEGPYAFVWALRISADGSRLAYWASDARGQFIVADGKEQKAYAAVGTPVFDPARTRLAYKAKEKDKWFLLVDGEAGARADGIGTPFFAPAGGRLAYAARDAKGWAMVIDGKKGATYDRVGDPVFSADGSTVAYTATKGARRCVVVEKTAHAWHESVGEIHLTADGKKVAYGATDAETSRMIVDGKEGPGFDGVHDFIWGPDGRYAHGGYRNTADSSRYFLVIDGKSSDPSVARLLTPAFGPDGRVAYTTMDDITPGPSWVVVGDERFGPYKGSIAWLSFQADGTPAYGIESGSEYQWVVGGEAGPRFEWVPKPVIGPGGVSAFAAKSGSSEYVVAGTNRSQAVDRAWPPKFAADGRSVGFAARVGRELIWKTLEVR